MSSRFSVAVCPYCGGSPVVHVLLDDRFREDPVPYGYKLVCASCGCQFPYSHGALLSKAVYNWNNACLKLIKRFGTPGRCCVGRCEVVYDEHGQ